MKNKIVNGLAGDHRKRGQQSQDLSPENDVDILDFCEATVQKIGRCPIISEAQYRTNFGPVNMT